MLIGRIEKHGRWWVALCEIVGAFTQGRSRREAMDNLAEVVELRVDRPRFKATVTELEPIRRDVFTVLVEPSEPAWLAAAVLRYQRARRGLSLADVARSLGAASRNAYASRATSKASASRRWASSASFCALSPPRWHWSSSRVPSRRRSA